MSKDISSGKGTPSFRTGLIAAFAILTVGFMLSVPFIAAVDSDAALTADKGGFVIKVSDGVTDTELDNAGTSRAEAIEEAIESMGFEIDNWFSGTPSGATTGSFTATTGEGQAIEANDCVEQILMIMKITDFSLTVTFTESTDMFDDVKYMDDDMKEIAEAIQTYFGATSFAAGDKIVFTGDIDFTQIYEISETYGNIDDTTVTKTSGYLKSGIKMDCDVTAAYTPAGSSTAKTVEFSADGEMVSKTEYTYKFDSDITELKDNDPCTINVSIDSSGSSSISARVSDEVYEIEEATGSLSYSEDTVVETETASSIKIELEYPTFTSSDHISLDKTYDGFESAFDDAESSIDTGDDKKSNVALYIGIGVGAVVIVGLAAFFLIKKNG